MPMHTFDRGRASARSARQKCHKGDVPGRWSPRKLRTARLPLAEHDGICLHPVAKRFCHS
eukprot:6489570-Amphidinium_carterae.5